MPTPIRTPRVNNNDDLVRLAQVRCVPGSYVRAGEIVAEIETDKANVTVETEQDGYILGFGSSPGQMVAVGSVLAWIGESADETMPIADGLDAHGPLANAGAAHAPTLKAMLLLRQFGLTAPSIPFSGDRLTAGDVMAYADRSHTGPRDAQSHRSSSSSPSPLPPGTRTALSVSERAMLNTVAWHRDVAAAGYVELEYATAPWDRHAAAFQQEHRLLTSPLLALMAYRLVQIVKDAPKANSTITEGGTGDGSARHEYSAVNLGFTMQSGSRLTLLTVRNAGLLADKEFVDALGELMRCQMRDRLSVEDTTDATIGFSSMARWGVTRHVPLLPPRTALIVAHTAARNGVAALGASYDHRILTGGDVAVLLRSLSVPFREPGARV